MKTKLFTLFVALFATSNLWAKFQYGNLYYEPLTTNTAKVVDVLDYPTSITIPSVVMYNGEKYTVTEIDEGALMWVVSLTSITIPNSVTKIGDHAFYACTELSSITIPNSVTSIGEAVLSGCDSLISIVVEKNNPQYDSRSNCNAIIHTATNTLIAGCSNTIIPDNVMCIGNQAFRDCRFLTSITIPNSVTSIGDEAFLQCYRLSSVIIGNSVTTIGDEAFLNCRSLPSITIPNSVTSIGDEAFSSCNSLSSVTIGNGVTTIGYKVFYSTSLTSITIPNSVTSIGDEAFYNCRELSSITIPNSVTSIGASAFLNCDSLTSITIPQSVTIIGDYAFRYCDNLTEFICEAIFVPSTGVSIFDGSPISSATLYVPDESVDIYKYMKPWSEFSMILPISQLPSGVENVQTSTEIDVSKKKIISDGQVLILYNDKSYNVMGQEIE